MKELNKYIFEKFKISKDIKSSSEEDELEELFKYLKTEFDQWKLPYKYEIEKYDGNVGKCLRVDFNHKITRARCGRICGEINRMLRLDKKNYMCYFTVENNKGFYFLFVKK